MMKKLFCGIIEFVESGLGKTIEIFAKFSAASRKRKRRGGVGPLDVPACT